jgi:hypothetical protein
VSYPEQLSGGLQQAVGVGVLDDDAGHIVTDHGGAAPAFHDVEQLWLVPRSPTVRT